jgi:diaminopimelate decarboxylase
MEFIPKESTLREMLGEEKSAVIHDLDELAELISTINLAFGSGFQHCLAVKSNPILKILSFVVECGMGLECASEEEVHLALAAGCSPGLILHNGPAKSQTEIDHCLSLGVRLVLNDLIEVTRVAESDELPGTSSYIALRINPLVGGGSIEKTSVSVIDSKFGIPVNQRRKILRCFEEYDWLNGMHVHSGSQGMKIDSLVEGVSRMLDIVQEVEAMREESLDWVDIGGGLPFDYRIGKASPNHLEYANELKRSVPELFNKRIVFTEFGRSIMAGNAIAVSRIEKIWFRDEVQHLISHLGSDMFIRWALNPDDWHHRISIISERKEVPTVVHGPLCYNGDRLGGIIRLPNAIDTDLLVFHDVGAYTISMWSGHCNRVRPVVFGIRNGETRLLLQSGSIESIVDMWSIND